MRNIKVYSKLLLFSIASSLVLTTGCASKTSTVYIIETIDVSKENDLLKDQTQKQDNEFTEETTENIISETEYSIEEGTSKVETTIEETILQIEPEITIEQIQTEIVNIETETETETINYTESMTESEDALEIYEPSNNVNSEEEVIGFLESISNKADEWALEEKFENVKDNVTSGLATFILFMSGDSTIGGYTFSSLTDAGKQKVEILFIKMDNSLESKFPGYKDKIEEKWDIVKSFVSEKYNGIKTKVYNYIISQVGEDLYQETLENFSSGWDDMKESFSNVFGFIGDKISDAKEDIIDWAKENEKHKEKVKK